LERNCPGKYLDPRTTKWRNVTYKKLLKYHLLILVGCVLLLLLLLQVLTDPSCLGMLENFQLFRPFVGRLVGLLGRGSACCKVSGTVPIGWRRRSERGDQKYRIFMVQYFGKRSLERQKQWISKVALEEIGCEDSRCIELSQDRV
jgi:hypothetical protein